MGDTGKQTQTQTDGRQIGPAFDEWRRRFETTRPIYVAFTERLEQLLDDVLARRRLQIDRIEARTKTVESFYEKIQRDGKDYADPFMEMTDICGLRIITLFTADAEKIAQILREEFVIDALNSVDKGAQLDADQFGYQSIHAIVSLSPGRAALTEWEAYANLKAEIQVRTVLQHAWAAINHSLAYKSTGDIPKPMLRRLNRISAHHEAADDEFLALQSEMSKHHQATLSAVESGKTGIGIDGHSLDVFFEASGEGERWDDLAYRAGFEISHKPSAVDLARRNLLSLLSQADIKTLDALSNTLAGTRDHAPEYLRAIRKGWQARTGSSRRPVANWYAIVRLAVLLGLPAPVSARILQSSPFGPDMTGVVADALKQPTGPRAESEGATVGRTAAKMGDAPASDGPSPPVPDGDEADVLMIPSDTERRWSEG